MIQLKSRARDRAHGARAGEILAATVTTAARARCGRACRRWSSTRSPRSSSAAIDGATPAFKGLYGFPGSICTSINHEIVHGIPSKKRVLKDGDIVSIDVGVGYEGYFTDSATTVPVGDVDAETQRLLEVTRAVARRRASPRRVPGNHIGDIGAAVQAVVEAAGFSVVRDLVGHGIGVEFHEEPQVPNYGKPKRGLKLVPGLTIAIEPMVNVGRPATRTLPDKWTIVTRGRLALGALRAHGRDHRDRASGADGGATEPRVSQRC